RGEVALGNAQSEDPDCNRRDHRLDGNVLRFGYEGGRASLLRHASRRRRRALAQTRPRRDRHLHRIQSGGAGVVPFGIGESGAVAKANQQRGTEEAEKTSVISVSLW